MKENNKHRLDFIYKVLNDIVSDDRIAENLIFKWGTSLALFYWLERFSEDLDFSVLDVEKAPEYFQRVCENLQEKWYSVTNVKADLDNSLNCEVSYTIEWFEYHIKIEVSKVAMQYGETFDIKLLDGRNRVKVLSLPDNFAHKIWAFHDRRKWRDIFDIWFYIQKWVFPNTDVLKYRIKEDYYDYLKIILKDIHRPFLIEKIKNVLKNFSYLDDTDEIHFINNLRDLINKTYFWNKLSLNFFYFDQVKKWEKIITIVPGVKLLVDGSTLNPKYTGRFTLIDEKSWDALYFTSKEESLNKYINKQYISDIPPVIKKIGNIRL